jgi:hypothetical protein
MGEINSNYAAKRISQKDTYLHHGNISFSLAKMSSFRFSSTEQKDKDFNKK